jgi:hypothetical protein
VTFLQDFQVVERPYPQMADRLINDPHSLLTSALDSTRVTGDRLLSRVSPADWPPVLAPAVELSLGASRKHDDCLLVAFRWQATRGASLFPTLDGDLEAAPLGPEQTQLVLRANYDAGAPELDRTLLHRVAEATARTFLVNLCGNLNPSEYGLPTR